MMSRKWLHRVKVSLLVSLAVMMVQATMAFAQPSQNPSPATVGNALPMQFNVSEVAYNNLVELTWVGGGTELETFDMKKSISQTVNYVVNKGSDFATYSELEEQNVDIWLQITAEDPNKIEEISVNGNPVTATDKAGETYYLMMDDVTVSDTMAYKPGSFQITFNALTGETPFTASLVAMADEKEELKSAPTFSISEDWPDGQYTLTITNGFEGRADGEEAAWFEALEMIESNNNLQYIYNEITDYTIVNNVITITMGGEKFNSHTIKISAAGYEDYEYTFWGIG